MDRLGVGFSVLREVNPRLVYCAITGYGQDGPLRSRAGHDLNYLARTGVLALSGEAGGPPVQAAAQIADVAGGALMAAFGIMAALRSGEGQFVDISMADGALSLLAMPAAQLLAGGAPPRRGEQILGGRLLCYRPYAAPTATSRWARWSRSSGPRSAAASGREDLIEHQFDAARHAGARRGRGGVRVRGRAPSGRPSTPSTTAAWSRCWSSRRCWQDEQIRARGMVAGDLLATPVQAVRDARGLWARRPARPRRAHRRGARRRRLRARTRSPRCARRGRRSDVQRGTA